LKEFPMRALSFSLLTLAVLFSVALSDEGRHHHALTQEELGSVHFSTSCAKSVEAGFNRAVALLHSFEYEQSDQAFTQISAQDPECAMSQWGVAMANYHGLWENGNTDRGRAALQEANEVATASKGTTTRERAYIAALDEIYKQDGKDNYAHAQAFEQRMGSLQAAYPDDTEAAVFHALMLAVTAPKTDKTFANQRKCGEILEPIFQKQPHHPGVAHYMIHCFDNPVLAERGLVAARAYAKIAPSSSHAQHMPSHIFTRVGSWDESIASNSKSAAAAANAETTSKTGEARDQRLHAMDYLEYAYLQSGRVKQARTVLDQMNSLAPASGLTLPGNYATAAIPARYAIELGNWKEASGLQVDSSGVPFAQAITWMAVGIGGARSGNLDRANQAEKTLASLRDTIAAQKNTYWSGQVEVQRREVAAWIAEKSGKHDEAVNLMRSAAELEETMEKHPVTPGAISPAREMLAQLLLPNQPKQALAEFESVLKVAPNRFNALYGAATAADAAGDRAAATDYFRKLNEIAVGDERPELVTARQKMTIARK
jgi:tetratricopeptide (TPR) repeat protein